MILSVSDLSQRLVEKSIEAFIMGIEIYNKPTIKYRIEGFSFFICNAWELMLKAHLINRHGEGEIYYKDNPERTISLENCVEKVFTNKNDPLRKNLERIVHLRNISTHFITEDYEEIYAPLFQACVTNFSEKIKEFHNVDITEKIAKNFLTLGVRIDHLSDEEILATYGETLAERLIQERQEVEWEISENNSSYAIPVSSYIYITKQENKADISVKVGNNADSKINIVRDVRDPNNLYPHTTKKVVDIINKKLNAENIVISKLVGNEVAQKKFTTHDFQLFVNFYGLKNDSKYSYYYKIANRYSYSQRVIDLIFSELKRDPDSILINLKKAKK